MTAPKDYVLIEDGRVYDVKRLNGRGPYYLYLPTERKKPSFLGYWLKRRFKS